MTCLRESQRDDASQCEPDSLGVVGESIYCLGSNLLFDLMDRSELTHLTLPPPGETPGQKKARMRREVEARHGAVGGDQGIVVGTIGEWQVASRQINDVEKYKVYPRVARSLCSECNTLDLKMKYAPMAWKQERALWRPVIQLDLLRSVITIIEALQAEADSQSLSSSCSTPQSSMPPNYPHPDSPPSSLGTTGSLAPPVHEASLPADEHQPLKLRLDLLRRVEGDLKRLLGARTEEVVVPKRMDSHPPSPGDVLEYTERRHQCDTGSGDDGDRNWDEVTDIIASFRGDIMVLWADEAVRAVLKERRIRLEDSANFFLNNLERITAQNYEPSDDDIVHARSRTSSTIQEHKIQFEDEPSFLDTMGLAHDFGKEWIFYDVGGARTIRHAWECYFDDARVIIFPISCFDERLAEDPRVNRLEDSIVFWRAICSSQHLSQVRIIVFLTKCDLLERKLKAGVRFRDYVPSYGDRPNEAAAVIESTNKPSRDTRATATTLKTDTNHSDIAVNYLPGFMTLNQEWNLYIYHWDKLKDVRDVSPPRGRVQNEKNRCLGG
ncbi:G-protein alpha subunit-domain-containing protein [Infundibulicybe gibba]|nr:G-protein alpha subunit-domain-containing protein [Infundibulicybe gibba]